MLRISGLKPYDIEFEIIDLSSEYYDTENNYGSRRDFALSAKIGGENLSFKTNDNWLEPEHLRIFLAQLEELTTVRSGRARLDFMIPNFLELFSITGSSGFIVHCHFEVRGSEPGVLSTVVDFNTVLDSEYVEQAFTDLRQFFKKMLD